MRASRSRQRCSTRGTGSGGRARRQHGHRSHPGCSPSRPRRQSDRRSARVRVPARRQGIRPKVNHLDQVGKIDISSDLGDVVAEPSSSSGPTSTRHPRLHRLPHLRRQVPERSPPLPQTSPLTATVQAPRTRTRTPPHNRLTDIAASKGPASRRSRPTGALPHAVGRRVTDSHHITTIDPDPKLTNRVSRALSPRPAPAKTCSIPAPNRPRSSPSRRH